MHSKKELEDQAQSWKLISYLNTLEISRDPEVKILASIQSRIVRDRLKEDVSKTVPMLVDWESEFDTYGKIAGQIDRLYEMLPKLTQIERRSNYAPRYDTKLITSELAELRNLASMVGGELKWVPSKSLVGGEEISSLVSTVSLCGEFCNQERSDNTS